jgi:uncharacterized protein
MRSISPADSKSSAKGGEMINVQRKIFFVLFLLLPWIGVLATAPSARADSYKFGVSKPGGAWYPIGTAVARLAEKDYGDSVTLDIGGGMANAINVLNAKLDFGLTFATTVADAMKGVGPFKGKDASSLRLAAVNYPQLMFWVVWADSDIKTASDLKGKRVSVMPKRFSAQGLNKQMLGALGMSYDDFSKVVYLGFNDSVAQMKDGHIDAVLGPGEEVYAPTVQLAAHRPIRILSFTDEEIRKIRTAQPAVLPFTMDKKHYDQPQPVHTVESFQIVATHNGVPEERVFKLAKLFYGHLPYFIDINKSFRRVKVEDAAKDMGIARHPGLTRYLKEAGVLQ